MHPPPAQSLPAPTPFGTLIVIPVEIRLKIYRPLLERGQLAILRTSRAINMEAIDKLYRHAICRLGVNYDLQYGVYPSRVPWSRIQNAELHVNITNVSNVPTFVRFKAWLKRFSASGTSLKACSIRLDLERSLRLPPETFTPIKALAAFPKVTLAISGNVWLKKESIKSFKNRSKPGLDRDMYYDMHCEAGEFERRAYKRAAGILEPTLGSAVWFEDEKGMHLEFHPKKSAVHVNLNDDQEKAEEEGQK